MKITLLALVLFAAPLAAGTASAQTLTRGWISVNGGYQASTNDFSDGSVFTANAEQGRFDSDYTVEAGPTLDVAGGATIVGPLGVGVGVTRYSRATPIAFTASIPHPFFFSQAREVAGDVAGLKREELAVHIQARGVFPVGERLQVMVFGGPSFFQVKQGIVTDFDYAESYPYDTATFTSGTTTEAKASRMGMNVGADVGFFFTRQVGVGFGVQFSGATVEMPSATSGATADVKIGGLQAGGGLRLRF